jgi:site-specific recombinase XerD
VLDFRDRAILKTYLYTGIRLATACRLRVKDFHQDGEQTTLTINEKGNKHRTIGIHFATASCVADRWSRSPDATESASNMSAGSYAWPFSRPKSWSGW